MSTSMERVARLVAFRHWLRPSLDRVRILVSVGSSAQANLVIRAAGPYLFL